MDILIVNKLGSYRQWKEMMKENPASSLFRTIDTVRSMVRQTAWRMKVPSLPLNSIIPLSSNQCGPTEQAVIKSAITIIERRLLIAKQTDWVERNDGHDYLDEIMSYAEEKGVANIKTEHLFREIMTLCRKVRELAGSQTHGTRVVKEGQIQLRVIPGNDIP